LARVGAMTLGANNMHVFSCVLCLLHVHIHTVLTTFHRRCTIWPFPSDKSGLPSIQIGKSSGH